MMLVVQAFGTIGPLETAYFRETGKQLLLSEQNLMDCGWYLNNKACFGGYQVNLSWSWEMDNLSMLLLMTHLEMPN